MDTLDLAAFFGALHRHRIHDTTGLNVDVTAGNLTVRVYDRALYVRILLLLTDTRAVHGYEPGQVERQHGILPVPGTAGVVVRLILARSARKEAA